MKKLFRLITLSFLLMSTYAFASSTQEQLTTMLLDFMKGASENDPAAHDRFWSDELIYTSSSGTRFGKASIMESLTGTYDSGEEDEVVWSAEDIQIQEFGDTAVVAFRLIGKPTSGSEELMQYFNTGTFHIQNSRWKAVAWQATRIPEAEEQMKESKVVAAEPSQEPTLKEIMQGLREDVFIIADGLFTDNMDRMAKGASGIAHHPSIPGEQVQRVAAELGPEMPAFKQFDMQVHDLSLSIITAARSQDRESAGADFQQLINGCLACHTSYKERVANVLNEPAQ